MCGLHEITSNFSGIDLTERNWTEDATKWADGSAGVAGECLMRPNGRIAQSEAYQNATKWAERRPSLNERAALRPNGQELTLAINETTCLSGRVVL